MEILRANDALHMYIDQLLELEEAYNPKLRESADEKAALYSTPGSILLIAQQSGVVIGERSGLMLKFIEEDDLIDKIPDYATYMQHNTLYVHSFTVLPAHRGIGVGKSLARSFIQYAKDDGVHRIIGHAREGPSKHINELLGSRILGKYENWYDTGETYYFHELSI